MIDYFAHTAVLERVRNELAGEEDAVIGEVGDVPAIQGVADEHPRRFGTGQFVGQEDAVGWAFEGLRDDACAPRVFICATNVRTGPASRVPKCRTIS